MPDLPARSSPRSTRFTGGWLLIARLVWCVLLLLSIGKVAIGMPIYYAELNSVCMASEEECSQGNSLTPRQVQVLESAGLSLATYANIGILWEIFNSVIWAGVGLLIFLLRPNDWLALIASGMMILFPSAGFEIQIRAAYPALGVTPELIFNLGNILMFLFIGLFPSGRFSPRWMRWYWLGMILFTFIPSNVWLLNPEIANFIIVIYWVSFLILGAYSQIYRYRKDSTAIERQQTKWVVMGFSVFAGTILVGFALSSLLPENTLSILLFELFLFDIAGLLIPLSIGFSVLRYRLWDVDIIIRRTLVYSALTLLLGLVYFGLVTVLQNLFSSLTNQQSTVAIVLSTLAIAALFNPLRRRVQDLIDRHFYRKKYDAEKILTAFAAVARNETDLEALSEELVRVVQETMQPEQVSLWLRKQ